MPSASFGSKCVLPTEPTYVYAFYCVINVHRLEHEWNMIDYLNIVIISRPQENTKKKHKLIHGYMSSSS